MLDGGDTLKPFPDLGRALPKGWRRARLDDVADRASGHTPDQGRPEYWNGGVAWVSLADSAKLDQGYISETDKQISHLGIRHSSAVLLPPETVILSRDAGVGKSAVLKSEMAVSQHFIAWSCSAKRVLDPWFLYAWMQTQKPFFERMAVGSTIKTIGLPIFKRLTIDFPPLPEQRRIAAILRTWDEALEKLAALRAAKARRLEGIAQQLLAPSRAIGRGVPQSNWAPSSFGDVFEERQDKNAGLGSDDVVTVGKYAIRKQSEHFTRSVASKDLSNYWTISPGDFVYDPMSAYYGAIGRYAGSADGIVSPAYRVIKLSPDVDPEFMVALLRTHHVRFLLEARSSQGNKEGKRRLLQRDEFESIEFKLPSREAQREIAAKLAVFRTDLELTEREIEAVALQKRGLMQKLLTGEWRVKLEAPVA
ncbi:restriction endonuclease subunit S [Paracoccus sp. S3-43]|uniref:restriction endonuclease subunit S n=1 Tax=Paracoccus sp. S3-43 TaxID=3030011 RepID=UPI0023B15AAE|nr:restriction endonuclease subunit S [Paracoccus sp. S3-43]WEF25943.1 restriction endonuclease subunit S [Paracoccus sp. S3-43]